MKDRFKTSWANIVVAAMALVAAPIALFFPGAVRHFWRGVLREIGFVLVEFDHE